MIQSERKVIDKAYLQMLHLNRVKLLQAELSGTHASLAKIPVEPYIGLGNACFLHITFISTGKFGAHTSSTDCTMERGVLLSRLIVSCKDKSYSHSF